MADIIRRVIVKGESTGLQAVTTELQGVAAAQNEVAAASAQTATVTELSTRQQLSAANRLRALRSTLEETYRAQLQFERGQKVLNQSLAQGALDAAEHTRLMGLLAAKYDTAAISARNMAAAQQQAAAAMRTMTIAGAAGPQGNITFGPRPPPGAAPPAAAQPMDMIAGMGAVGGPALAANRASANMIAGMSGQMSQLGQNTRLTALEVTNLGMQFNDIAVMAASGQNPMVLIMQQGMQVAQIMMMTSVATQGLKATLVALGAAVKTFLTNPFMLAVAAAAALAGGILLLGRVFNTEITPMEDVLKEQEDLLKKIAARYGEAAVAARRYNEAQQSPATTAFEAQTTLSTRIAEREQKRTDLLIELSRFRTQTVEGLSDPAFVRFNELLAELIEGGEGAGGVATIRRLNDEFARLGQTGPIAVRDLAMEVHLLLQEFLKSDQAVKALQNLDRTLFDLQRRAEQESMAALERERAEQAYEAIKKEREERARAAREAAEAAERERQRRAEYIDDLRFEQSLLNETELQQEILNNLRQLGAEATAAERAEVEALTTSIFEHNEAMKEWEKATEDAIGRMDEFRSSAKGILSAFVEGGPQAGLQAITSRLTSLGEDLIIEGLFGATGKPGGGLFGGLIQDLLGGMPEKPVATMNVTAGVVNVGGVGAVGPAAGSFRAAQEAGMNAAPVGTVTSVNLPNAPAGNAELATAINQAAVNLGINPIDLANVIAYETGGTFSPSIMGGKGGRHMGLIQFGPSERAMYGASASQTAAEQMVAVEAYLRDRGVKPGMGLMDLYSTINAGRPGLYGASDRPGMTVSSHVAAMAGYRPMSEQLMGMASASSQSQSIVATMNESAQAVDTLTSSVAELQVPIEPVVSNILDLGAAMRGITPAAAAPSSNPLLFGGLFQHGGHLGAGKWGIAGEHGPEIIHGPANVTPVQQGGVAVNNTFIDQTSRGVRMESRATRDPDTGAVQMEYILTDFERAMVEKYQLKQPVARWGRAA
jgi:hypothetical protein